MTNKEAIKKLLGLLKKYKKTIIIILICLLISTGLNLCIPLLSKHIMDDGFIGGNSELLIKLVILTAIIYGVNSTIDIMKEQKRVNISSQIQYFLSEQSFSHLMKLRIDYFNNTNYAEILNSIHMDIGNMISIADESMFFVVTQGFSIFGGVIGLFIIDYRLTILVLVFIPVKYIVMKYFAKKRKIIMDELIEHSRAYAKWFGDSVGGIREVKLFGIFTSKHNEFSVKQKDVIEKQKKMNMLGQWNIITDSMMVQILITVLYIVGSNLVFKMQLSVGSIFAFVTYSTYVTGPISAILNIGYLLSGIIPSTKRYYEFMELQEEDYQEKSQKPEFGDIILQNISFSYDKEKEVLKNINIEFPKGSKSALVGRNGCGKSTIINLLTRIHEPSGGKIYLKGTDISKFGIQSYRDMVSIVSQQIYLFSDTIRNNISLYKKVEDGAIMEAAKDSGLEDFIKEVSLDYLVGSNGSMLSGGQKQKIALARALVHNKPIIIFDEATSNTDIYSEMQINSLLHTRLKNNTVVIVTHKQDVLKDVDNICVINSGEVIASGAYQEICKTSEEFRKMVNLT